MRQFDPIVKHLMDRFGLEFARLLFNEPGLEVLQRLDTQQSTIKVHQNDMTLKQQNLLHLAALLHDIGKFRQRATGRYKKHQEHSYEFVTEDFADFFSPCGEVFRNAIRHHHNAPNQLQHLMEKQVIVADRLSATEREDEERETEDFVASALISVLSLLDGATKEYRYALTALDLKEQNTVIPSESVTVDQGAYEDLWHAFTSDFRKATADKHYTPAFYQTIVALLHKYTARMPSATPWGNDEKKTVLDISLYDHLRTTAAIAACIGHELSETEVDAQLGSQKDIDKNIATLIKGDISGIQKFLYQIVSEGAANQLRGRSFYLQLLTEAIAHWVLKQLELPITNLLLASGGHFYLLAPDTASRAQLDTLRQTISENLWTLHNGDIACILAGISIKAGDFEADNFSKKWHKVSEKVAERKQQKWSEMNAQYMFDNLFEPHQNRETAWGFEALGKQLRKAEYLATFEIPEAPIPEKPNWRNAINAFGMDVHIYEDVNQKSEAPEHTENAGVYRLGNTDFLTDSVLENLQWDGIPVSYDFRTFRPVIAIRDDTDHEARIADYDYIADAAEGAKWLGALRMDVDDLGKVFSKEKLKSATISRLATLSETIRLFFEGYVPNLCRTYNKDRGKEILEVIYAGGDDLFIVGGWSALPEIAESIRNDFRKFVTGEHVTLSGGIAIEHKKYPLYQFAAQSGDAEDAAKGLCRLNAEGTEIKKDAISFLRMPMSWCDFGYVSQWHHKFLVTLTDEKPLPRDILTRLSQIYSAKELEGHRWAWRSLYYFHRLLERNKSQETFIRELQRGLNSSETFKLKEFIHVVTRWSALRIRSRED